MALVAMGATAEKLSPDFYDKVCPKALPTIKTVVEQAIGREPRIGASLLRLHFHDCFVNVRSPASTLILLHWITGEE